jgi:catechol 2,3-dioxygenase-like lactoylglutathione lyase family enzyme
MSAPRIEHVNVTVTDADRTAQLMEALFDWRIRWRGPARDGGRTIHVGSSDHYLALYAERDALGASAGFDKGRPLNHIGIEVDDLDATEARVIAQGLTPFFHGNYEPGRRFYFFDADNIEYEVISYR